MYLPHSFIILSPSFPMPPTPFSLSQVPATYPIILSRYHAKSLFLPLTNYQIHLSTLLLFFT